MEVREAAEVARISSELRVLLGIMEVERQGLLKSLLDAPDEFTTIRNAGVLKGWDRAMRRLQELPQEAQAVMTDSGSKLYN